MDTVWIGGSPLADFSGTSYSHMATPFCIRGLDPGNEIKSYKSRVEFGNHIKFKKSDEEYPVVAFADDCLRHMQQHGLDTVFYMEGAATDGFGGKELFTYHSRYSKDAVDTHTTDPSRFDDRHARTVEGVSRMAVKFFGREHEESPTTCDRQETQRTSIMDGYCTRSASQLHTTMQGYCQRI